MPPMKAPVGLARLNQILQMAALTAGEPANRYEKEIAFHHYHSQAKGSEFDHVFAGLNEGTFPSPLPLQKVVKTKKSACSM